MRESEAKKEFDDKFKVKNEDEKEERKTERPKTEIEALENSLDELNPHKPKLVYSKAEEDIIRKAHEVEDLIPSESLIQFGKDSKAKLLICVTQYNEPLSQLIETLAGIYRSYYELGTLFTPSDLSLSLFI